MGFDTRGCIISSLFRVSINISLPSLLFYFFRNWPGIVNGPFFLIFKICIIQAPAITNLAMNCRASHLAGGRVFDKRGLGGRRIKCIMQTHFNSLVIENLQARCLLPSFLRLSVIYQDTLSDTSCFCVFEPIQNRHVFHRILSNLVLNRLL